MKDSMTFEEARQVFDIRYGASKDEIKKRFRELALQHHPDKGGEAEKFIEIRTAYAVLMKGETQSGFHAGGRVYGTWVYGFQTQGESVTFDFERLSASFRSAFRQTRRLKRELEVQIEEYAALKLGCPVGISITPVGYYIVHINFVALISAIPLGDGSESAKAHIDQMSAKQTQYRDILRNRESQEGSKCKS